MCRFCGVFNPVIAADCAYHFHVIVNSTREDHAVFVNKFYDIRLGFISRKETSVRNGTQRDKGLKVIQKEGMRERLENAKSFH